MVFWNLDEWIFIIIVICEGNDLYDRLIDSQAFNLTVFVLSPFFQSINNLNNYVGFCV
jgi:hypothetical protein